MSLQYLFQDEIPHLVLILSKLATLFFFQSTCHYLILFLITEVPIQSKFVEYVQTSNPFIVAKKTISPQDEPIIENSNDHDTLEHVNTNANEHKQYEIKQRRRSQAYAPTSKPVKTRPRSNTITINIPPKIEDIEEETDEYQFVDIRDEILLIKDQFDQLLKVLDDDILGPVVESIAK